MKRTRIFISLAGLVLLGVGAWMLLKTPEPESHEDASALLVEAQALQRAEKFHQAAAKYEEVLQKDPEAYDALVGLGLTWQALGYSERAVGVLSRAAENRVGNLSLERSLARAFLSTGQRQKAIALLEPAYRKNPGIKTGFLLADAYYEAERFGDAVELYLTLLEEKVRSNRLILRLHRALLLNRNDPNVLLTLITPSGSLKKLVDSTNLRWKGDLPGAMEKLDEDSPLFLRRKIQLLLEMGKYEEVLPLADRLQGRSRERTSITYRADGGMAKMLALLLLKRLPEAQEFAAVQLKELDLEVTALRGALAAFRHTSGKTDEVTYLKEVEIEPGVARNDHYLFLAVLARAREEVNTCKAHLEQAGQASLGLDYPAFLISRLQKEWD